MSKPNFFCGIEALQALLQMDLNGFEPETALTVDLIEAPYLFIYTPEADAWELKVLSRGELYDHVSGSGIEKADLRVDRATKNGSGQTSDKMLSENMGAFFTACQQLSRYIRKEGLEPMYSGLDPEQAGIMLETGGSGLTARVVEGKERPEMMCTTLFGGTVMCRPYMDDFMERSMEEESGDWDRDWEKEWREQRERERKQRAEDWMKKYSRYLEKDPRIIVNGSKFVFTGVELENWTDVLEKMVSMGGIERSAVSGKTDYLVVDPGGYGDSKIKEAVSQRLKGKNVKVVLLEDFLAAVGMADSASRESAAEAPVKETPAARSDADAEEARRREAEEARRREESERQRRREEQQQRAMMERQKEEERRREEEKKRKEDQRKEYKEAFSKWKEACRSVEEERDRRVAQWRTSRAEGLRKHATSVCEKAEKDIGDELAELEKKISDAETALSGLGLFKFSEKKTLKAAIASHNERKDSLKEKLNAARLQVRKDLAGVEAKLDAEEKEYRSGLEIKLPLPAEPAKPGFIAEEERQKAEAKAKAKRKANKENRDSIPAAMEQGKLYTAAEIGELFDESAAWATPKLNALATVGVVVKTPYGGKTYYSLA